MINRFKLDARLNETNGFSVIELLVVTAIIATLSVALVLNFRIGAKTVTSRLQTASVITSDIRRAQSMALAGSRYQNNIVCGYGVRYVDKKTYQIYAKPVPAGSSCSSLATRNYQSGDFIVENRGLISQNMEIRTDFSNIFFEPPNPRVYVNNVTPPSSRSTTITIQLIGQQNCSGNSCTTIDVSNSGQIDLN